MRVIRIAQDKVLSVEGYSALLTELISQL